MKAAVKGGSNAAAALLAAGEHPPVSKDPESGVTVWLVKAHSFQVTA